MGIGYRIREARERLGLTQTELGAMVGVTGSAITNYEKETSHPKEQVIYKLMEQLNVDANYLFQDVVNIKSQQNDVSLKEYEIIKKYRNLHYFRQLKVMEIIDNELEEQKKDNIWECIQPTLFDLFSGEEKPVLVTSPKPTSEPAPDVTSEDLFDIFKMFEEWLNISYSNTQTQIDSATSSIPVFLTEEDDSYEFMKAKISVLKKLKKEKRISSEKIVSFLWGCGYDGKISAFDVMNLMKGNKVPSKELYDHIYSYLTGNYKIVIDKSEMPNIMENQPKAAHNDHMEETGEYEKVQKDLSILKKPD